MKLKNTLNYKNILIFLISVYIRLWQIFSLTYAFIIFFSDYIPDYTLFGSGSYINNIWTVLYTITFPFSYIYYQLMLVHLAGSRNLIIPYTVYNFMLVLVGDFILIHIKGFIRDINISKFLTKLNEIVLLLSVIFIITMSFFTYEFLLGSAIFKINNTIWLFWGCGIEIALFGYILIVLLKNNKITLKQGFRNLLDNMFTTIKSIKLVQPLFLFFLTVILVIPGFVITDKRSIYTRTIEEEKSESVKTEEIRPNEKEGNTLSSKDLPRFDTNYKYAFYNNDLYHRTFGNEGIVYFGSPIVETKDYYIIGNATYLTDYSEEVVYRVSRVNKITGESNTIISEKYDSYIRDIHLAKIDEYDIIISFGDRTESLGKTYLYEIDNDYLDIIQDKGFDLYVQGDSIFGRVIDVNGYADCNENDNLYKFNHKKRKFEVIFTSKQCGDGYWSVAKKPGDESIYYFMFDFEEDSNNPSIDAYVRRCFKETILNEEKYVITTCDEVDISQFEFSEFVDSDEFSYFFENRMQLEDGWEIVEIGNDNSESEIIF